MLHLYFDRAQRIVIPVGAGLGRGLSSAAGLAWRTAEAMTVELYGLNVSSAG